MKVDRKILDGIAAAAERFGGVGSGRLSVDGDPLCPWGMAMWAGVVDTLPYSYASDEEAHHFGRDWPQRPEDADLPMPTWEEFDDAIGRVRNRLGVHHGRRVPWAEVVKQMKLGPRD